MSKAVVAGAVVAALVALGVGGTYWYTRVLPERQAQDAVRGMLTDPGSAQFSDMERDQGSAIWCGRVNSRNRMGGYVGFVKFVVDPRGVVILDPKDRPMPDKASEILAQMSEDIAFRDLVQKSCPKLATVK